jgi:hypothetical protein
MERVHNGNAHFASPDTGPNGHADLHSLFLETSRIDALNMPKEVNFDLLLAYYRFDYGGLRRVVVALRNQQRAIQGFRQLLGRLTLTEIIEILGCIRPIIGQLGYSAIPLSPKIERLPSNDEGLVAELENACQIKDDLRRQNCFAQAKASWKEIEDSTISTEEKKPLRSRSSERDIRPSLSSNASEAR